MNPDYNKKRYLQLLDQRSIGDNSNNDELLRYSCMLTNQLYWEIRDQYLSLMERYLNGTSSYKSVGWSIMSRQKNTVQEKGFQRAK